jgi:hypothetical protein
MSMPDKVLNILRSGKPLAAEIKTARPEFRAFVMVIPQVPNPHENPDAWIHWGHRPQPNEGGVIRIKDISFISGFEIRFVEHHAKYTDEDWGWDYDYVLDDTTTRIKRIFISEENEIESSVAHWLKDLSQLQEPDKFNSSLLNSPIEGYLDRPDERPHLWE